MALAQILPGPASSQTGFAIGLLRGGGFGGFAAWLGFTLPSALLMYAYAVAELAMQRGEPRVVAAALHGLQLAAVAVIAQAVFQMARSLLPGAKRLLILLAGAVLSCWAPQSWSTLLPIVTGGVLGVLLLLDMPPIKPVAATERLPRRSAIFALVIFALILFVLPLVSRMGAPGPLLAAFCRTGALVFGGGHVVLPVLYHETVARGWLTEQRFLAGYGVAQAMPGPLFTFAAYLGAAGSQIPSGALGAFLAVLAIFAPGLFLMAGMLPFWEWVAGNRVLRSSFAGIQASVVGLLLMAMTQAIRGSVRGWTEGVVCLAGTLLLLRYRIPPWIFVLGMAVVAACVLPQ